MSTNPEFFLLLLHVSNQKLTSHANMPVITYLHTLVAGNDQAGGLRVGGEA